MGPSCDHLEPEQSFSLDMCTVIGATASIQVVAVVSGGDHMFDDAPGDVLYFLGEMDPATNMIYSFGLQFLESAQVCRRTGADAQYMASYCQQGNIY